MSVWLAVCLYIGIYAYSGYTVSIASLTNGDPHELQI